MMRKYKKLLALLLAAIMVCGTLASCGTSEAQPSESQKPSEAQPSEAQPTEPATDSDLPRNETLYFGGQQ